jgi:hypothetical protein
MANGNGKGGSGTIMTIVIFIVLCYCCYYSCISSAVSSAMVAASAGGGVTPTPTGASVTTPAITGTPTTKSS